MHSGRLRPVVRHKGKSINDYLFQVHPGAQRYVFEQLMTPRNTLVCAGPGCGKSYVKQKVIDYYLENGKCVVELATIARVLHESRKRPAHSAYRLDTLQGFTGENYNYTSSVPLAKFRKKVERRAHAVCPRVKGGGRAELILVLEEVFAMTGPQIDYAITCAKAMPTISGVTAVFAFGDPLQCECIGVPTGMSNLFRDNSLRLLALSESVRFSGKLLNVVNDLRDCRKEISDETISELQALCLCTRNRRAAEVELCTRHTQCDAGNRAVLRDYKHHIEVTPVGGRIKDRRVRYIPVGAQVIITRNMRLGPDEVWLPHDPDEDQHNALQDRKTFVANGDIATVVGYPYQDRTGFDADGKRREFTCIDANDDKISHIRLRLESGAEIELMPTKTDGMLTINATLARCLTIHSQQGRTLTSGSINMVGSYNTRTLGLVAFSRFRRWDQIHRLVLEYGATEFRSGGPSNPNHWAWTIKVLEAEDAIRQRFYPSPRILGPTPTQQIRHVSGSRCGQDVQGCGPTSMRGDGQGLAQKADQSVHERGSTGDPSDGAVDPDCIEADPRVYDGGSQNY